MSSTFWSRFKRPKTCHLTLVGILLISAILRLTHLAVLPAGFSWDEAAIGYNGYSILVSRRDEWLERLPISFKSFGDFKAPVAIYATTASSALFGLSEWSTRLPMAVAGIWTTLMAFLIGRVIFRSTQVGLLAATLTAVSPINIHYSRIAFDSGISVAISATAFWLFFESIKERLSTKKNLVLMLSSGGMFVLSIYAYHSTKIFIPLALIVLGIWYRKQLIRRWRSVLATTVISTILLLPLANEMINGDAAERFYMTSSLTRSASAFDAARVIGAQFFSHLDPEFLIFGRGDENYRHQNQVFGVLSYIEFGSILGLLGLALFSLFSKSIFVGGRKIDRETWLVVVLILLALTPSAISEGAPSSNRAHGMVPFIQILAGYALFKFGGLIQSRASSIFGPRAMQIVVSVFVFALSLQTMFYAQTYLAVYRSKAGADFQEGLLEAVRMGIQYESKVDKVIVSSKAGQVYIYALYAKQLTPFQWQHGALSNYTFRELSWSEDQHLGSTLLIGDPEDLPVENAAFVVRSWDGEPLYIGQITATKEIPEGDNE